MAAQYRPTFAPAARVSCIHCRQAMTPKGFEKHDCEERRMAYEADMQYIDDQLLGYAL